jgi:hypothetical protein
MVIVVSFSNVLELGGSPARSRRSVALHGRLGLNGDTPRHCIRSIIELRVDYKQNFRVGRHLESRIFHEILDYVRHQRCV